MVWNEKLKREIPDGWEAVSVNDISDSYRGVSYAKDDLVDEQHGLLVLRGNNIQNSQLVFDSNVAYIPESFVSDEQKIRKGHIKKLYSAVNQIKNLKVEKYKNRKKHLNYN